jgi:hypothetical protein
LEGYTLKKKLFILAIVQVLIYTMLGCSSMPDYSRVDRSGEIIEIDKDNNRILVDDKENGQIWIDVSKVNDKFFEKLEVLVWLDGDVIDTEPQEGTAERIDVVK